MRQAVVCSAVLEVNVRICRVADFDWRLARVYFLAF
jgi:hypothetical protein